MTMAIGWIFIAAGIVWAVACVLAGGMTEYRATWRDISPWIFLSVPSLLIGIGFVGR